MLDDVNWLSSEEAETAFEANAHFDRVNLTDMSIPPSVIELVPEGVARENVILPLAQDECGAIRIVMGDPADFDTIQKLQFILNKDICPVLSPREQIIEAINRHYGK